MNEKDYNKRFVVIGVINGAHYELSWKNESNETTYEETYENMLMLKNSFNENREKPFLFSAKIGETVDMIRTDTIEKMYVKTMYIQKEDKEPKAV